MSHLAVSGNIAGMDNTLAQTAFADSPGYTAEDVVTGKLDTAEAMARTRAAIAAHDADVQAFFHVLPDGAPNAPSTHGVLAGVPIALKDNIDTARLPTGYGSAIYTGYQPGRDAACAALLELAGAHIIGKTVSTEFAHRAPGATRNPWNLAHTPGGSSSGSAAAVGAGMVPLALGTQTTGSVIRPAAYCGVLGYKPTYGDINVSGVLANSPSFDTVGIMARCVTDLVLARRALLDVSVAQAAPADIATLRVGVCRTPFWDAVAPAMQALVINAAQTLEAQGARVVEFADAGAFAGVGEASVVVSGYEFARTLAAERRSHYAQLSAVLRDGRMADGLRVTHADYVAAQRRLAAARLTLDQAFAGIDVVLTPAAPGAAPEGLAFTGSADLNMLWTSLHTPALTLPVTRDEHGLPLGLQLAAPRYADDALLAMAQSIFPALKSALWV